MLPSKYDTKRYSPFLVIPPPPFFFYLSFFFFLIIFIIANSYIFFIGSDETGSDRVFRNSNRNVSLLYMYICDIYIFSFFVVNFYDGYIYIYIYRNIEFLGCTFFSPARTAYRNFSSSLSTLLQHCCFQPTAPAIEWTDIVEEK